MYSGFYLPHFNSMKEHRLGLVLIALMSLFIASCTTRTSGKGLRQTRAVWHGSRSCTTGIEHLPFGWDVPSQALRSNTDKTVAAWVYVTVCPSRWGFGPDTPVGYQVVLYDPGHPALFSLEGDELQKYLDENTV